MANTLAAWALAIGLGCSTAFGGAQTDRDYSRPTSASSVPEAARVDINHATLEQLLKVPGMTRSWAQRIVRFKLYRTKQDLVDLGVVPDEVYNRIRDCIIAHREKH